jgi:uncharacterized integral membrane protein
MKATIQPTETKIRFSYVHQVFLALNVGVTAAIWTLVHLASQRPTLQPRWVLRTVATLNHLFRHPSDGAFNPGWEVVLGAWTISLALLFLVPLFFLRPTVISRLILDPIGGMIALGTIPIYWLLVERPGNVHLFSDSLRRGLLMEIGLVFILIVLTRRRPMPAWYVAALLIGHYGLWTVVILDHVEQWRLAFELTRYLVSPCAGIVWALYANRARPASP